METELRRLQLTLLEMLKVVDDFCKKHDIHYSLSGGSLLGAVRHQGFIPWDDDIDICMIRPEYNQFIMAWKKDPPVGYYLQNKESTPAFTQSFSKIRKDHTTFLQEDWERGKYHTGIFLDIFPFDRVPSNVIQKHLFYFDCLYYQLLTREFVPPQSSLLVKNGAEILLRATPQKNRKDLRRKKLGRITRFTKTNLNTVDIATVETLKMPFPADLFDDYTTLPFEDSEFMCFSAWDKYLQCRFGNYMQLPPEEERVWKHHPLIIDFDHNVDDMMC